MRGARAKAYKKLMQQYTLTFSFRPPYQCIIDPALLRAADSHKMDLAAMLERTLGAPVKILITQCCIRSFYDEFMATKNTEIQFLIDKAKLFERRRCNHSIDEPALSPSDCIKSVVGTTNKHRYVICTQDLELRQELRSIRGVPLIYINRSVMILEPMADASTSLRNKQEGQKFREGLRKGESGKRKRDEDDKDEGEGGQAKKVKKAYNKGPKGPNPLSVKKAKKSVAEKAGEKAVSKKEVKEVAATIPDKSNEEGEIEVGAKRKRRRKHKTTGTDTAAAEVDKDAVEA